MGQHKYNPVALAAKRGEANRLAVESWNRRAG